MIVRIMGEGQLTLADCHLPELNRLDEALLDIMAAGDTGAFQTTLKALIATVHRLGTPLADDSLLPSDLILPASNASIQEVRSMLRDGGEGLIPD
ncbi:hypothetical protein AB0D08_34665 [Kitasatospora sp. NPDC048540]|uniref:PspA-associated protein PspAA n=1 Tax=Kitasatospora sp. NPDC048540 TaxID=3155634 RepID=UPI0033DF8341